MSPAVIARIATALALASAVAACTVGGAAAKHPHARSQPRVSRTVTVRAGGYAVTLIPETPAWLGCTDTADQLGYPVPCPTLLPQRMMQGYTGPCLVAFMAADPGPAGLWRGWMVANGGENMSGQGVTPDSTEHLVMEAVPFVTANYDLVANGPVWPAMGRPQTVRTAGWITIGGLRMRWIFVPLATEGSAMAGHLALVWTAGSHTYALGFHDLWGLPLNRALDIAVARSVVMTPPSRPRSCPDVPTAEPPA